MSDHGEHGEEAPQAPLVHAEFKAEIVTAVLVRKAAMLSKRVTPHVDLDLLCSTSYGGWLHTDQKKGGNT
jgi:hypothetical protein